MAELQWDDDDAGELGATVEVEFKDKESGEWKRATIARTEFWAFARKQGFVAVVRQEG